ncbi:hypothetical protein HDV02_006408, partial [Globomyces sp. JEL0801]
YETFLEQLENLKRNLPLTDNGTKRLLDKVRTCGALIPHSPQRKTILRSQIFGLTAVHGWPAFFVTINPSDLHNPMVKLMDPRLVNFEDILNILTSNGEMNENETFVFEELQSRTNASDPVACAKFFNLVVRTYIECILGWDQNSHSYNEGYFGKTVAHFGVVEEQQRKQLHLHLLVWVENYGSYESFHDKMKEDTFKRDFIAYIKHCE